MRRLAMLAICASTGWATSGCVEVNRGAIVQMNLRNIDVSAEGEHYQLFAVVHGGAVPIQRFKVLRAVEECGQDVDIAVPVTLIQAYDNGVDRAEVCDRARRLGAVDKIDLPTATLAGGVRIDTRKSLADAESVFISVEPDGDGDPRPSATAMTAALGAGRSPQGAVNIECLEEFCAEVPDSPTCASIPTLERERRGVLVGTLLRAPVTDVCNAVEAGEIAIVPAQDDTEF